MAEPDNKIVPFGKYKGQPIEALAADKQYSDWLAAQPWFREKFQPIYNIIVNNFGEPSETPEHNAMQALFLEDAWAVAMLVMSGALLDGAGEVSAHIKSLAQGSATRHETEKLAALTAWLDSDARPFRVERVEAGFEVGGMDVFATALLYATPKVSAEDLKTWLNVTVRAGAELKPVLGDDYPAVLRQMKRHDYRGHYALIVDRFDARGATWEQCVELFKRSGFTLVTLAEVQEQVDLGRALLSGANLFRVRG